MHALLALRSSSRPSSPAPDQPRMTATMTPTTTDARSRPLSRLTVFRRASPSPAPTPPTATPVLAHDGSYLDTLGLRLADGATRALAPPPLPPTSTSAQPADVLRGRRPLPAGRGKAFTALIAAELNATSGNPHLQRAIVRLLPRPLSVLLTSLSTQLLPLLTPTSGPLLTPTPTGTAARAPFLVPESAAQVHALALAGFAAELLEGLDAAGICGTGAPSDGLRGAREALDSLVGRVIPPLLNSLKADLVALLDALEAAPPTAPTPPAKSNGKVPHSVTALGALVQAVPAIAKALATYTATTSPASTSARTAHASTLISLAWRALVALAYRPLPAVLPSISSVSISAAASGAGGAPTPTPPRTPPASSFRKRLTPPSTPPGGRFTIRLPREPSLTLTAVSSSSRPPSPDSSSPGNGSTAVLSALAHEARTVSDLLAALPRPPAGTLARDAVDEAFGSLTYFAEYLSSQSAAGGVLAAKDVPDEVPTLIALPLLLRFQRRPGGATPPTEAPTVAGLLGLSESEYRERCLAGFGRAEGCEDRVVQGVLAREGCVVDDDLKVWLTDG